MTRQFTNKVIAITGGASGIGLATAHLLAERGASLALADLNADALTSAASALRAAHGDAAVLSATPIDVRNYDAVESWISGTVKASPTGRLDGAANLAGVIPKSIGSPAAGADQQDFGEWDFCMDVNLKGVMHCVRAELRAMAEGASVVNAASIAGLTGRMHNASYTASKHAVVGLTRSAAKDVGMRGVRVNAICPGRIDTPMLRTSNAAVLASSGSKEKVDEETNKDVALRRDGKPEEVARLIAFLLSDESSYITGASISIDGGWYC